MKDSIKSVVVLTVICLIVSALLSAVNFVTAPVIKETQDKIRFASLYEVLPQAENFEEISLTADMPQTITGIFADTAGGGYAVTVSTTSQYSSDNMLFTVGIDGEGNIVEIKLTQYAESKDFGADYPSNYVGTNADTAAAVDTVGGVTYSSTAFKNAVADVFTALAAIKEGN